MFALLTLLALSLRMASFFTFKVFLHMGQVPLLLHGRKSNGYSLHLVVVLRWSGCGISFPCDNECGEWNVYIWDILACNARQRWGFFADDTTPFPPGQLLQTGHPHLDFDTCFWQSDGAFQTLDHLHFHLWTSMASRTKARRVKDKNKTKNGNNKTRQRPKTTQHKTRHRTKTTHNTTQDSGLRYPSLPNEWILTNGRASTTDWGLWFSSQASSRKNSAVCVCLNWSVLRTELFFHIHRAFLLG